MPKIVDRDEMKKNMLEGAMKGFTSKGYHAATIADVAEVAGLGKGALYLCFKNKEAIAEAMVTAHFDSVEAQFFTERMPDPLETFLDRLSKTMDVPDEHAGFIRVFFEVFGLSFASDTFAANVAGFFGRLGAHYAGQLLLLVARDEVRDDTDPRIAGRMLASLVDGMILRRGLFGIPKKRSTALRREAIAMFLKWLKVQAS